MPRRRPNLPARARPGATLIYCILLLGVLIGFASLAVDLARMQLAKNELQAAVDAAARHAASGMPLGINEAQDRAIAAAADNKVAGAEVVLNPGSDIEFGLWDAATGFTSLSGDDRKSATAVRVTARRDASRGNAVPTVLARIIGINGMNVRATATATRGEVIEPVIDADACPWLAGMPNGSRVTAYDGNTTDAVAPANAPLPVNNLPLTPGASMYFRQVSGVTSYEDAGDYGPDGNLSFIVRQRPANGINATTAPLNSLVGIFLDGRRPDTYAMAPELNFSTAASRNFDRLEPKLKQVFFIGDGLNSRKELQEFVVPAGATRFYLGIMDEKGWWWDNTGNIKTFMLDAQIMLVK